MLTPDRHSQRGQVLVLFTLALTALVLGTAVVLDGGYAFAQRRETQNAADFAAMAGTRIVGMAKIGHAAGTAANVRSAITEALEANDAELTSAVYVDASGAALGDVFSVGTIPQAAFGVVVEARTDWQPFLLGAIGVTDWAASARATARTPGQSIGGGVMPVGLQDARFNSLQACPLTNLDACVEQKLTSGQLNIPGGFGWLTFGVQGAGQRCDWTYSLGMTADGSCGQNNPYLQSQIGPPANSHGCCHEVGREGSSDRIGSLTGNTWGDLSYYIENKLPVWVPVYNDQISGAQGAGGYYGIVGFGAIIFAESGQGHNQHSRWLKGARVDVPCPAGWELEDSTFCKGPGGAFQVDVTGEVQLVR
jgi:hypothetical protein